jgi:small subunit ribosomal protein S1
MATEPLTAEIEAPMFVDLSNMPSMDDLLGEDQKSECNEGTIIIGKVVDKRDSGAIVDFGYKAEGLVEKDEFEDFKALELGASVRALLVTLEDEDFGMPLLSVEKAILQEKWEKFIAEYEEGSVLSGMVKYRVKGGLIVDVGVDAFLPGSQVDLGPVRNLDELVATELTLKIIKVNNERRNIVVSRRELLEEEKARQRSAIMADILPGQLRKGMVKNITDFGAFIDLKGLDGLLHITDMSWGRISHPSEMLNIGDEVEAVILDVDREKERVSLGLKQKSQDPWEAVDEKYPMNTRIKGRVVNVMPYGAFVEIEEGIEGLIHVSEMSWTKRITRASDVLQQNEEVEAVVLDIQKAQKKISLGLRQTQENPWEVVAKSFPPGSIVKGKVRNMTTYGAFIEIQPEIDGMVHVSDMSWTRKINNPAEMVQKGDDVEAVVLKIDPDQRRISLGMKQMTEDPWAKVEGLFRLDQGVKGMVTKVTSFGAFVTLDHDIDGLIHISQISDERVEKVRDVVRVGQEVEARVIKIDENERRIGLSLKTSREPSRAGTASGVSIVPTQGLGQMADFFGNDDDDDDDDDF